MSSQDDIAAIIAFYDTITTGGYWTLATQVLIFYEYLTTFFDEVKTFWGGKCTGAMILFFLNRYMVVVYTVFYFTGNFQPFKSSSCTAWVKFVAAFEVMQYLPWAGFSALRAHALSRNIPISVCVFTLSIVPIIVNFVDIFGFYGTVILDDIGCIETDSLSLHVSNALTITSRVSLITADVLLIIITWLTLSRQRDLPSGHSFIHVLLRDGTVYFICLLILNSLHLTFSLLSVFNNPTFQTTSFIAQFSEPLTGILVWRFMLNLQAVNRNTMHLDSRSGIVSTHCSHGDTLAFQRVIGSLGSFVTDDGSTSESAGDSSVELDHFHLSQPASVGDKGDVCTLDK